MDALLTVDDRLLKRAARKLGDLEFVSRFGIFGLRARFMIAIDQLTDEQFERHALDVLKRELGPRWPGPVFAAELL